MTVAALYIGQNGAMLLMAEQYGRTFCFLNDDSSIAVIVLRPEAPQLAMKAYGRTNSGFGYLRFFNLHYTVRYSRIFAFWPHRNTVAPAGNRASDLVFSSTVLIATEPPLRL